MPVSGAAGMDGLTVAPSAHEEVRSVDHPSVSLSPVDDPRQVVAKIEQKALRLSALLRDLDNHPIPLDPALQDELDAVLDQLGCRIAATLTLHQTRAVPVA